MCYQPQAVNTADPLSNDRLIPSFDVAGDFVHVVFSLADGKLHEDGKYV